MVFLAGSLNEYFLDTTNPSMMFKQSSALDNQTQALESVGHHL